MDRERLIQRNRIILAFRIILAVMLVLAVFSPSSAGTGENIVLTVSEGGESRSISLEPGETVADGLFRAGIVIRAEDTLDRPLSEPLYEDTTVRVNRDAQGRLIDTGLCEVASRIYTANLDYYTELKEREEEIRRRQELLEEYINNGPATVTAVINEDGTITTRQGTYNIVDVITMEASAYCPCEICCGEYASGYTADGSKATAMHTVATSDDYPFGTLMYIPYFDAVFEVEDRGGAIQDNRIDIYYDTHQEALIFGRHTITVYIIN